MGFTHAQQQTFTTLSTSTIQNTLRHCECPRCCIHYTSANVNNIVYITLSVPTIRSTLRHCYCRQHSSRDTLKQYKKQDHIACARQRGVDVASVHNTVYNIVNSLSYMSCQRGPETSISTCQDGDSNESRTSTWDVIVFPDIPAGGVCMYEFGEKRLYNIGNNFIKSLIDISRKPKVNNNNL